MTLGKSKLTWSGDGATVTKSLLPHLTIPHWGHMLGTPHRAALNELRVNRMLSAHPPPVPVPALVRCSRRGPSMTFEAVDGVPLGPKFPSSLLDTEVDELIALALALGDYRPRRRWFRRLNIDRRLNLHFRSGLLTGPDALALGQFADRLGVKWRFAHGDITARNVLLDGQGRLVLIDWEWAGLYPVGYELAFLWFSLVDVPGGRARVEAALPVGHEAGFLLSATLVQLLHFQLWLGRPNPHIARHEETLGRLLEAVRVRPRERRQLH
jgi:Ser/Thr protein kinase RdoA (MazF antagonist)